MLGLFLLSLFVRKFVGLQLIGIFHIGYLSIMQLSTCPPTLYSVLNWQYPFGYNGLQLSPNSSYQLNSDYNLYGYFTQFGFAVNVMIFVVVGIEFLGLFLLLISKCINSAMREKI